jgi:ATP-dependent helicase HrpB
VVLSAPPGSGKTTLLPLLLLSEKWLAGRKIILLEPRRLAARAAARRMAELLGEPVGEQVGYRVRHESRVGPRTRIEVVTEGILTRILQHDPELSGCGLVIFDEFHERHLQGDLGLVLALQARELFRPDLKLLLMSATLAGDELAAFLGGAARLQASGRLFPVQTVYLGSDDPSGFSLDPVARAVFTALDEASGDLLVFLPGAGEIRRLAARLEKRFAELGAAGSLEILPLFGDLPRERQERIFQPGRKRRVILATDIAESSLTVPGVRVVVDSGWRRVMRFDAAAGMGRLQTVRISRAAADQRRGRAGREAEGVCYRLWKREQEAAMAAFTPPEILSADLSGLALELALWGTAAAELRWLTQPPEAGLAAARKLLIELGALDQSGRISDTGRRMAALGIHPRLARMILAGRRTGCGLEAVRLAVLLENRDLLAGAGPAADADLEPRLGLLAGDDGRRPAGGRRNGLDRQRLLTLRRAVANLARRAGIPSGRDKKAAAPPAAGEKLSPGELLAAAFPDRIARKREDKGLRFRLAGGGEAFFPGPEPLAGLDFLVVAELAAPASGPGSGPGSGFGSGVGGGIGTGGRGRVRLAAAYSETMLRRQFKDRIKQVDEVSWDAAELNVRAVRREVFGALVLSEKRLSRPPSAALVAAWLEGLARCGLKLLNFDEACRQWCARVEFLRRQLPEETGHWPACDEASLLREAAVWLGPLLGSIRRREELAKIALPDLLKNRLGWKESEKLDRLAPESLRLPGGRRARLDYLAGDRPVLQARVQELFGWTETPTVAGGRVRVLLQILSPARRPVQVTDDLAGFWRGAYAAVRRELRGRYPKHAWPEDPQTKR